MPEFIGCWDCSVFGLPKDRHIYPDDATGMLMWLCAECIEARNPELVAIIDQAIEEQKLLDLASKIGAIQKEHAEGNTPYDAAFKRVMDVARKFHAQNG
jgi:hypothetical protein